MCAWTAVDEGSKYGVAIYNFDGDNELKLSLDVGDAVNISCHIDDWYYGFAIKNREKMGIFPKSFICIRESVTDSSGAFETILPKELTIVHEITTVLREWGGLWKELYLHHLTTKREEEKDATPDNVEKMSTFQSVYQTMIKLVNWRRLIMSSKLTVDELKDLQQKITNAIDIGNAILGLDLVVRDDRGNMIDPMQTSTIRLYRQHQLATKRIEKEKEKEKEVLLERHPPAKKLTSFNLYVNVKNFVCRIGENADILLALYDAKEGQFFSDNYIMKWGTQGMPKDLDMLNNLRVIFTDLSSTKDAQRDRVFLVCQIIRVGRMDLKESDSKKQAKGMRRPFGVASIELTEMFRGNADSDEEKQFFIPFLQCGERDFMEAIIKKSISAKDINHKGQGLWVTMRKLLGDFAQVQKDYPHLATAATSIARKMGFPDVIMPGDVRNDIYVTLMQGEFRRGGKMADKNVEVAITVCNKEGEVIPNVINEGAGGELISQYKSIIYYHEDKPRWFETIKLAIPINEFYNSHLKFTLRHRSTLEAKDRVEKPFAMSYIKLMNDDGTTLSDVIHDLLVYRIDSKKADDVPQVYFQLPATLREQQKLMCQTGPPGTKKVQVGLGGLSLNVDDSLEIQTLVCSTKLTHNVNLMGLLKWRDNPQGLEKHLRSFMKVDGEEIVKFLQDTLDALFNILMENSDSDLYDNLVFDALVFLVGLVSDMKYSHFKPVLDVYIEETFSATLAYNKLMVVLKYYIECSDKSRLDALLRAMKSLEYIFKFIVRSRMLFAALNENRGQQHFDSSIEDLFSSFSKLMSNTQEMFQTVQEAVLIYLPSITSDLICVYSPLQYSCLLVNFVNGIPKDQLLGQKMQFIGSIVHSPLFLIPECRQQLLQAMLGHINSLMSNHFELDMCVKILSDIMDLLFEPDRLGATFDDLSVVCSSSLRTAIQTVATANCKSQLVSNCVAVITSILRQMTEAHYQSYIEHFETTFDLSDFLMEILTAIEELVTNSVYPCDWNEMILLQNWVFLKALRYFSNTIRVKFINPFQNELWMRFFNSAIAFATQPSLQLEHFSNNKRNRIISRYRDMRREMSFEIRSLWYNLGQHKIEFIPDIVGPILQMTLIPENELRKRTIPIFFDMMQCEFMSTVSGTRHKRNFNKFEQAIIVMLDRLITDGHGDENYQEMFYTIVKSYCEGHTTMRDPGLAFVNTMKQLMQLLLEYRAVFTENENRDSLMCCTVSLLNFYHDIQRHELYTHYLDKLCDLHLECDNFTEAAYTLMLYTKMISWSDESLPQMLVSTKYPNQRLHRDLKESLYYDAIKYFDQGKMWEMGIELCKELTFQYETETFDYVQLSSILRKQADLYDSIMTKIRPEAEYFRVGYYGLGFPSFLQNRVFVYRGKEYERHGDFVARLQNQFPNAQMMKTLNPPSDTMKQQQGQFLQINKVTPVMELKEQLVGKKLSEQILKYYKVNEVQKFTYSRRKDDSSSDVTHMWVERTVLVTTFPLPGILRWFPVTSTQTFEVSPLQLAIETLEETNQKISSLVDQHRADPLLKVDPLGMVLNGVVDAAVNGGIANYKLFYTDEYMKAHIDDKEYIQKLRQATAAQLMILKCGLDIHRTKVPEALQPFHAHMESRYHEMKVVLEREYGIKVADEELQQDVSSNNAANIKRVQSMPASRHLQTSFASRHFASAEKGGTLRLLIHHDAKIKPEGTETPTVGRASHVMSSASFCLTPSSQGPNSASRAEMLLRAVHGRAQSPQSAATGTEATNSLTVSTLPRENQRKTSLSNTNQSQRGSIISITSTSSSKTSDSRDSGIIELNQPLTPVRPRRPESSLQTQSRPTSDPFKQSRQSTPNPNHIPSPLNIVEFDNNEPPPPLPEKSSSSHADYANVGMAASRASVEGGGPPPIIRRATHRDRPQLPVPTTPTLRSSSQHFQPDTNSSTTTSTPPDNANNF